MVDNWFIKAGLKLLSPLMLLKKMMAGLALRTHLILQMQKKKEEEKKNW